LIRGRAIDENNRLSLTIEINKKSEEVSSLHILVLFLSSIDF